MIKTFCAVALAGTLLAGSAYAQGSAQSPEPNSNAQMQNRTSTSSETKPGAAADTQRQSQGAPSSNHAANQTSGQSGQIHFVTQNRPDIWRASKLDGVDIYNDQNEKIGDISDVLIDRDGRVEAVVIGVGGFLGMGEHNVAVSFDSLKWQMNANSGTTGSSSGNSSSSNSNAKDYPAKAILPGATKDQLKNAPEFKYAS